MYFKNKFHLKRYQANVFSVLSIILMLKIKKKIKKYILIYFLDKNTLKKNNIPQYQTHS
jgi:hypothetical protein